MMNARYKRYYDMLKIPTSLTGRLFFSVFVSSNVGGKMIVVMLVMKICRDLDYRQYHRY